MTVNDATTLFDQTLAESDLSDKQKAVLQASLTLFSEKGFTRTTTSDIAQAAGVSEGTVYKRFKTKNEILNAILTPFVEQVIPKAASEFAQTALEDAPAKFDTFLTRILTDRIQFALRNIKVIRIIISEAFQNTQLLTQASTTVTQLAHTRLLPLIEHYQQLGQLVDWPAAEILKHIIGALMSDVVPGLVQGPTAVDVPQVVQQETTFLMKGLRPEKS